MKITKKQLSYIARALNGVSTDATRLNLGYVRIEPINGGKTIKIVSCDGCQIVTTNLDAESMEFSCPAVHVHLDNLKALKGILKDCRKYPDSYEYDMTLQADSFYKLSYGSYNVVFDIAISYPDYKSIIPSEDGYDWEVSFDAAILLKMVESMSDKHTGVSLRFKGPGKPILVTLDRECSSRGVLMPRRSEVVKWGPAESADTKTA